MIRTYRPGSAFEANSCPAPAIPGGHGRAVTAAGSEMGSEVLLTEGTGFLGPLRGWSAAVVSILCAKISSAHYAGTGVGEGLPANRAIPAAA